MRPGIVGMRPGIKIDETLSNFGGKSALPVTFIWEECGRR
jgi:hypothetical protein